MRPGETFFDHHLWVIVATPGTNALAFNLTTRRPHRFCDTACIIQPGEHTFVHQETVVEYRKGAFGPQSAWERLVALGRCHPREPVSASLLRRIQDGALASKFCDDGHQRIIREALGLPQPL